jgi:hypothetical protein
MIAFPSFKDFPTGAWREKRSGLLQYQDLKQRTGQDRLGSAVV